MRSEERGNGREGGVSAKHREREEQTRCILGASNGSRTRSTHWEQAVDERPIGEHHATGRNVNAFNMPLEGVEATGIANRTCRSREKPSGHSEDYGTVHTVPTSAKVILNPSRQVTFPKGSKCRAHPPVKESTNLIAINPT